MATHKVPQDVETDDKLIGFLSLKQFIFVIAGLGFGYLMFFFATKVQLLTGIIWFPPTAVCLVLGLYQRHDQPVEVYLASALRFYFKPRKRIWDQEGFEERVIITAPPKIERNYTKNFTGDEAVHRLGNLSRLMDSRGWASKLATDWQNPALATAAASDDRLVNPSDIDAAQGFNVDAYTQPVDMMDELNSPVARTTTARVNEGESNAKRHALEVLEAARQSQTTVVDAGTHEVKQPNYQVTSTGVQQPVVNLTSATPVSPPPVSVSEPTVQTSSPPDNSYVSPQPQTTDDGSVEISLH